MDFSSRDNPLRILKQHFFVFKSTMAFIKFLGTAGTRYVVIEQLRASGGMWISAGGENILLDPGPGALVRSLSGNPKLDPARLSAVVLSHRHLDHANDVNIMIEAMTSGGKVKKGAVFAPRDAFDTGAPVIFHYLRSFPRVVDTLREGEVYRVGEVSFTPVKRMVHPGETYGFRFRLGAATLSVITDTAYFEGLEDFFHADLLVVNVVMADRQPGVSHLSLPEAEEIIGRIRPERAFLTHFGRKIIAGNPEKSADEMSARLGIKVVAATDGMLVEI